MKTDKHMDNKFLSCSPQADGWKTHRRKQRSNPDSKNPWFKTI